MTVPTSSRDPDPPAPWPAVVVRLCLLRGSPADLPHAPGLLAGLLALQLAIEALVAPRLGLPPPGTGMLVLGLAVALGSWWAVLAIAGRAPRLVQVGLGLVGTGLVFAPLAMPLLAIVRAVEPGATPTALQGHAALGVMLLVGWKLAVNGRIWASALELPRFAGLGVALGVFAFGLLAGHWMRGGA
jgi:hypothetical protein